MIQKFFGCGRVEFYSRGSAIYFTVSKLSDITDIIIPFFNNYSIKGIKYLDFSDWCEAAEIIKNKQHLTEQGLEKLIEIKNRMNSKRGVNY